MINHWRGILVIVIATSCIGGCLINTHQQIQETGTPISAQTLQQIEVGRTTEGWLVATLGKPTSRVQVEGDDERYLLRYTSTVENTESAGVFLIFGGSKVEKTTKTNYFEVAHGVVVRHWSDP